MIVMLLDVIVIQRCYIDNPTMRNVLDLVNSRDYYCRMAMTSLEDQVRMHGIDPGAVTADAMMPAASLFHSFSDPNRLIILHHLQLGEHRVVDLTQHLGLSQSTVSKHLLCLRDTGMVTVRPEGRASVYSLAHSEALIDLLSAAERLLGLTGDGVILCTLHGSDIVSPRS